jgi:5'-3' exonuclease
MEPVVDAFWKTFHWTMHYFQTNEVLNWDWYYPYPDAPLLQDVVQYYETGIEKKELMYTLSQHLQIILPAASLREAKRRVRFVDEFYSETREPWMKKYDWEVKPRISLPWPTLTSVSHF